MQVAKDRDMGLRIDRYHVLMVVVVVVVAT